MCVSRRMFRASILTRFPHHRKYKREGGSQKLQQHHQHPRARAALPKLSCRGHKRKALYKQVRRRRSRASRPRRFATSPWEAQTRAKQPPFAAPQPGSQSAGATLYLSKFVVEGLAQVGTEGLRSHQGKHKRERSSRHLRHRSQDLRAKPRF